MNVDEGQKRLGSFLRACRERLSPEDAGLPLTGRRRTPGLRREEVAQLVGISLDYYTKIEQGRVRVSSHVLGNTMIALQLDLTEREYARGLVDHRGLIRKSITAERLPSYLQQTLDAWQSNPALVIGRKWDILAWNQIACVVFDDFDRIATQQLNMLLAMFANSDLRQRYDDWESRARQMLAGFRASYGRYQNDPEFEALISQIQEASPQFRQWWAESSDVVRWTGTETPIDHHTAGKLHLLQTSLTVDESPGMRIFLYLPQDEPTRAKLDQLYQQRLKVIAEQHSDGQMEEGKQETAPARKFY